MNFIFNVRVTEEDKADRATQEHLGPHMGPKNGSLSHLAAVVSVYLH